METGSPAAVPRKRRGIVTSRAEGLGQRERPTFNLQPMNINFQVVPGYDYGLEVVPTEVGEFQIVCNEFCGVGHHLMVGKIIVKAPSRTAGLAGGGR